MIENSEPGIRTEDTTRPSQGKAAAGVQHTEDIAHGAEQVIRAAIDRIGIKDVVDLTVTWMARE